MGNAESVGGRAVVSLSLNELDDRIKRAKITGTLDLNHQGIATFPHEILQLKNKITSFSCNYNSISRIPDGLASSMVILTRVELQSNWLTTLPPDFGQLTNLEILDLSYNLFSAIPDSLGEFRRLKELDLGWNKIQYLPASLLPKIASLKKLNLQGNYLTALPQEIGHLSVLTSLNLRNNKLQLLPPEIGKLRQLTDINLIENQLTYLPPELGELKDLLRLLIFDNKIDTLPVEVGKLPSLANVDMSNNKLDRLFFPPVFDSSPAPATDAATDENGWKKRSKKKGPTSSEALNEAGSGSGSGIARRGGSKRQNRQKKQQAGDDDVSGSPGPRRTRGDTNTLMSSDSGLNTEQQAAAAAGTAAGAAPAKADEASEAKSGGKEKEKEKEKKASEEGDDEEEDEFSRRRQIDLERELDRERERSKQQESQEDEQDEPIKWKRVQRLHITNNLLTEVPMSIAKAMKGLKVLCLQHNSIRHVPRELGLLKHLETIDLSYNQLEDLPIELSQLPLKILYVTNNRLRYTESLERMCGGLLSLQEVHLGANQLKQIPQSLTKLEFLTYINLYQNFVSVLPDGFEDLPSFCEPRPEIGSSSRQLILSYNRFEAFPPQLLKLRCLHELHFSGNAVPEIPDDIKNLSRLMLLSLGNNRVPLKLPESIGELASLERLYFRGTQLANVPHSMRKLIPRLIEIDVSPDTALPTLEGAADNSIMGSTESEVRAARKDKIEAGGASSDAPAAGASSEASGGEKPKENGGEGSSQEGEKASAKDSADSVAAAGVDTPESARRRKKKNEGDAKTAGEGEAKPSTEGSGASLATTTTTTPSSTGVADNGSGEDNDLKKSDRQRRKDQKDKEKEDKKAKKQKSKDEKRSKGGRFLQRLKGSADGDKRGNAKGDGSEAKGKGEQAKKVPKRPRLPKDWPLYITPNEEGTPSKRFAFGCAKMIGLGRKNEDTLMVRCSLTGRDDEDYFAVFDGHGGKHASRFAADNLHLILGEQLMLSPSDPEGALRRSFAEVHQRMLTHFQKSNLREECGCTAIVSLVVGNMVYVAGAGDSRAVFCYGNQVQRVSLDHKPYLEEETRRVRAVGGLVKVDSDYAKQYRVCKLFAGGGFGGLAVSRALGDFSWSPQVVEDPTIMSFPIPVKGSPSPLKSSRGKEKKRVAEDDGSDGEDKHAYLILACDGVWDVLSDEESAAIAMKERNALTAAVRIREHSYYLGSGDDICAVVVRLL